MMDFLLLISTMIDEMKVRLISKPNGSTKVKEWINEKNSKGSTPLHLASFKGHVDTIKLLIDNGADINCVNDSKQNVMHLAVQGNATNSLVYFYLKYHISINVMDENGSTAIHLACFNGSENCVQFLLSWNCNLNLQDVEGYTPLHLAVLSGN